MESVRRLRPPGACSVILAHLSDLHLGYRAYGRGPDGGNVRERDVALAFERAVDEIVRLRPAVVAVAGDVFDRPDPPPTAVVTLTRALERLRKELPGTYVLLVAGARDTPGRSGEAGILDALDTFPGVFCASERPRSLFLEDLSLQAVLLPWRSLAGGPVASPPADPRARLHLLVAYARPHPEAGLRIDPGDWDYLALGGQHTRWLGGVGVASPGSLERVGPEPWAEAAEEKGFLTVELPAGRPRFHPVPGRGVVALAPIRVSGDRDAMLRRVREVTAEVPGGIEDKIVSLTLEGVLPDDFALLEGGELEAMAGRALHLVVQAETPAEASPLGPSALRTAIAAKLVAAGADTPDRLARLERMLGGESSWE